MKCRIHLPRNATRLAVLVCVGWLGGCTGWSTVEPPFAATLAGERGGEVRLTLAPGRQVELADLEFSGDTIRGMVRAYDPDSRRVGTARGVIPLADVSGLEVRRPATGKTLALLGGIAGGLVLLGLVVGEGGLVF